MTTVESDAVSLQELEESAQDELIDRYQEWLTRGSRVAELLEWRKGRPFGSGGIRPTIARLGGAIIGSLSSVPVSLAVRGERINGAWQQDSVVGPAARGRGVGKALVNRAGEGYEILLAKSTSPPMYGLRRRVGFLDVPRSTILVRVLRGSGALPRRLALHALAAAQGAHARLRAGPQWYGSRLIPRLTHHHEHLRNALAPDEICPIRSVDYLNWRYTTCPGRDYVLIEILRGSECAGIVVLRPPSRRGGRAWIVDYAGDTRNSRALETAVSASVDLARERGAADVAAFCTSVRARAAFARLGFVDTRRSPRFTFRVATARARDLVEDAKWNFWWGDGDSELY